VDLPVHITKQTGGHRIQRAGVPDLDFFIAGVAAQGKADFIHHVERRPAFGFVHQQRDAAEKILRGRKGHYRLKIATISTTKPARIKIGARTVRRKL
jgi:hypothetical protein